MRFATETSWPRYFELLRIDIMTDPATPMMEPSSTAYIEENESIEWGKLVVSFEPKNSMPTG
jgi:hypothetical protein